MNKMNFNLILGVFALIAFLVLFGCNVAVGSETDLSTGLNVSNSGLSFDDSYLTVDGVKITSNKVDFGKSVKLVFTGLDGFKKVDGNIFLDASMKVTSPSGELIVDQTNMFSAYQTTGVNPSIIAKGLSLTFTTGAPMVSGETYLWEAKVWDLKSDGMVNATVSIVIN